MTILCGTDFSPRARDAADVAAAIARRMGEKLLLVHVVNEFGAEVTMAGGEDAYFAPLRAALEEEGERLRQPTGDAGAVADVDVILTPGFPDTALNALAVEATARVLVVGATGRRAPERWLLGSVAERTLHEARRPVLVVRDPAPLLSWLAGEGPLRTVAGADLSSSSSGALQWLRDLRAIGPADVYVVHSIYSPLPALPSVDPHQAVETIHPEVERKVRRQLAKRVPELPGEGVLELSVHAGGDRPDMLLAGLVASKNAGLLVVGAHQRVGFGRLWHESISRMVVRSAGTNVAVVPPLAHTVVPTPIPTLKRVVVATDLSPTSRRAVPFACGLLPQGGKILLLHVMRTPPPYAPDTPMPDPERARTELSFLVPADAEQRNLSFEFGLEEGAHVGEVICAAAEAFDADILCLGTHGHSRLASALLGSVSQRVVAISRRPVLLVGPEG